jgi:hypothetical protein
MAAGATVSMESLRHSDEHLAGVLPENHFSVPSCPSTMHMYAQHQINRESDDPGELEGSHREMC